jgi:hypothetical protein
MQTLRERNWLTEHEIKSTGKGRPLKIYALRANIDAIINYCEAEKSRESARTSEAIQAEGTELGMSSEGDITFIDLRAQVHRFLDCCKVLHQE